MNKKYFFYWKCLFLVGLMGLSIVSCSDKNDEPGNKDPQENRPTVDEVKTLFNGKTVLLQPNLDEAVSYLLKRLGNISSELTEDAEVVIMDETHAESFMNEGVNYSVLRKLWNKNKMFVFINPDKYAYSLKEKLSRSLNDSKESAPTAEDLLVFKGIKVFGIRADGTMILHEKIGGGGAATLLPSIVTVETENGTTTKEMAPTVSDYEPNDYEKGILAENVAKWLNSNAKFGEQRNIAFVRSDSEYNVVPITCTYHHSFTVNHEWVLNHCEDATVPPSTTADTKSELVIYGAYAPAKDWDIYDVTMYQEFPADKTFIDDMYVHEYIAYNYKFTGGLYYGPKADIALVNVDEGSIELEQIAPLPQSGQYNNTHYPMQISFGGGLEGSVSTSGAGLSTGLSMGVSLPYTTISFNHSEMPIAFSNDNKHARWTYSTDYRVYKCNWGFNPKPQDIPDIVHSFCHTDQAVSFIVNNSRSYSDTKIKLLYDITFYWYDEYADPWEHCHKKQGHHYYNIYISAPIVNRYFGKYTPYPMPGYSGAADSGEWSNLQTLLMNNINYRALCDETLKVGSPKESELDNTAMGIWREALESLVRQYDGATTNNEYLIGLARQDGSHISLGLHIKDGKWTIIEDVDTLSK